MMSAWAAGGESPVCVLPAVREAGKEKAAPAAASGVQAAAEL